TPDRPAGTAAPARSPHGGPVQGGGGQRTGRVRGSVFHDPGDGEKAHAVAAPGDGGWLRTQQRRGREDPTQGPVRRDLHPTRCRRRRYLPRGCAVRLPPNARPPAQVPTTAQLLGA